MRDHLAATIEKHRELYRADPASVTRMVVRTPPVTKTRDGQEGEPADAVGMNLSARLIRYIGHPEGYGEAFPWRAGLWLLRGRCRREHRYHREDKWKGSLCERAVRAVVMQQLTVHDAELLLGHDHLRPYLREGLRFIEEYVNHRRPVEYQEPSLPPTHQPLPGLHLLECPSCRRGLDAGTIMAPA